MPRHVRVAEAMALMVAPLAPHLGEELWRTLGHDTTVTYADFPIADPVYLVDDTSSTRCRSTARCAATSRLPPTLMQATVEAAALADAKVQAAVAGATPKKVIVVPGRMVNVVL